MSQGWWSRPESEGGVGGGGGGGGGGGNFDNKIYTMQVEATYMNGIHGHILEALKEYFHYVH